MRIYRRFLALVAACSYFSGLVPLVRRVRRRGRHLVILNYHRAAIGDLSAHLAYLRRHYRVMPLDRALDELFASTAPDAAARHRDRRTPLAITFDDGYYDNYALAARLALKHQTPITLFLVPGYMETRQRYWWYEADVMVRNARNKEATIDGRTYSLARPDDRRALGQVIDAHTRFASTVARREAFLTVMRDALGIPPGTASDDPDTLPFGWDEARTLLANPFVTFGAHTMHHPTLAYLSDPEEVRAEVARCRVALEQGLGRQITAFAYPIGKGEDIDGRAVQAVQEAGYRWAVTTLPGYNTPATEPHLLRRITTDPDEPVSVLAAQAAGIWHVFALSRLRSVPGIGRARTKPHGAARAKGQP